MSALGDGARVAYAGDGDDGLSVDDRGKVLSAGMSGSHVLWSTGSRTGEITLTANHDLVPVEGARIVYDDLDSGCLVTFAVRDVHNRRGAAGLLNAMNDEGHLATTAALAEEALALVATRLRQDPSFKEVLAQLEPDDGAEFVTFAAAVILRDAFREAS